MLGVSVAFNRRIMLGENTKFYIGANGNPVIVFDKYEIAPGAFGIQEFEINRQE